MAGSSRCTAVEVPNILKMGEAREQVVRQAVKGFLPSGRRS